MDIRLVLISLFFLYLSQAFESLHFINNVKRLGYHVSVYDNVRTSDGYILTLFRINTKKNKFKGPILLVHGLLPSGESWLINKPNQSLPLLLANDGYDVWIANIRGSFYSLNHLHWNSKEVSSPFWNFSFHEIGIYDLPALIDFILDTTKCSKLIYIGHSQGTTAFFVMTSTLPEYNDKIELMIGLGPSVFNNNARSPAVYFATSLLRLMPPIHITRLYNLTLGIAIPEIGDLLQILCSEEMFQEYCIAAVSFVLSFTAGFDIQSLDKNMTTDILTQIQGVSIKQLLHYAQVHFSGTFRQYDYIPSKNLEVYGTYNPPLYDLAKVSTKILLYYASNDLLCSLKDVKRLNSILSDSEIIYINSSLFSHTDYLFSKHAKELVFSSVQSRIANVHDYC